MIVIIAEQTALTIITVANKNMSVKDLKIFLRYMILYCENYNIKTAQEYIDRRLDLRDREIEHEVDHMLILNKSK